MLLIRFIVNNRMLRKPEELDSSAFMVPNIEKNEREAPGLLSPGGNYSETSSLNCEFLFQGRVSL